MIALPSPAGVVAHLRLEPRQKLRQIVFTEWLGNTRQSTGLGIELRAKKAAKGVQSCSRRTTSRFHSTFRVSAPCGLTGLKYLFNYVLRRNRPAEYRTRTGFRLIDGRGTLAGTLAEVFVRREYGSLERFRTIVDIGANMGSFAVYAAQSRPDARIFCYEPEQQNFRLLKQNIEINGLEGRVSVFHCAVASHNGRRQLAVGESPVNSFHIFSDDASHQVVNCTTLKKHPRGPAAGGD